MRALSKILLVVSIIISAVFTLKAESDGGVWKIHSVFNENRMRVVDTGDKVYCLTDNYLNAYNKTTGEFEALTKLDRLSDFYVSNIYHNKKKNYLVVTYSNYNIDILLADGTTVNIPDIKNLSTVADKTINDVTFGNNGIYIASKIGYIVVDDKDFKITKSAFLGSNVQSVAEIGNKFILTDGSNTYYADKSKDIKSVSEMANTSLGISGTIMPIDDNHFFVNSNLLYLVTIADNGNFSKTAVSTAKVVDIQATNNGFIAVGGSSATVTNKYYAFDKNGNRIADISLPAELTNTLLTSQEKDGSLWRLGAKGLQKVSLDISSATVTASTEEFVPNCVTAKRVACMAYNKNNGRVYITNGGPITTYFINDYNQNAQISSFDGSSWKNEVPNVTFKSPYEPAFDPQEPNTFYVGTWYDGVYKIKDNQVINKYDWSNSPHIHALNNWYCQVSHVRFDKEGNLWTAQSSSAERKKEIAVLPKEKLNKVSDLTVEDWIVPDVLIEGITRAYNFYVTSTGYKLVFTGYDKAPITIFTNDENFEITNKRHFDSFFDQDGRKTYWNLVFDFEEDKNGMVWMSHAWGITGFNPQEAFNEDFRVIRPKDDTGKYILDNVFSTFITVDDYNRKWVGTLDDGVYLLNEDCTKVLKHFNSSNSCFPNDKVHSICWNSNTQSVFIGFYGGLLEYKPENENDYTEIFVTPNRITPDYKGNITFNKVPVNSTLYIKNKKGETVKTIQASSSKAYWNGVDEKGKQVKTGTYYLSIKLANDEQVHDKVAQFSVIR